MGDDPISEVLQSNNSSTGFKPTIPRTRLYRFGHRAHPHVRLDRHSKCTGHIRRHYEPMY